MWRIVGLAPLLGGIFCLMSGCNDLGTPSATTYFLVARINPTEQDESYILPLSDPQDIATARSIIAGTISPKIVVAKIAPGSGTNTYVNKELIGGRTWNWHVTAFDGFADRTIEILDGKPSYVDAHLNEWINMTHGYIGFWSYTVTREVTPAEMR